MARQNEQKKERVGTEVNVKVLYINRCSKVVKGGRKFSFSALILVGDGKKVGYGFAKANELTDAIRKGEEIARKNMRSYPMRGTSVPHDVLVHQDGATLLLKPAKEGTGVKAGSQVRSILEMAGYKDVMAKSLGANNPLNLVIATFKALENLLSVDTIKEMRSPT